MHVLASIFTEMDTPLTIRRHVTELGWIETKYVSYLPSL